MRRGAAVAAVAAGALAAPGAAAAMPMPETSTVAMQFSAFDPGATDILAGDAVRWANASTRDHTVTADDGAFDSGHVVPRGAFTFTFAKPGRFTYHCSLHFFMRGEVDVHTILLAAPPAAAPGQAVVLRGRVAGAGPVVIERQGGAAGWTPVGSVTPDVHGAYSLRVTARESGTYRASAGGETTKPVALRVLDRSVAARVARSRRRTLVRAHVAPAFPHGRVVLELRLRDRFGWWPVRRARLDRHSRATFSVAPDQRAPARVVLVLADWATPLATSPVQRLGAPLHPRHHSG